MSARRAFWDDAPMRPFTVHEIALVRESFRLATGDPEAFAAAYFRELFALDHSARGLFRGDLRHLGHSFVTTLRVIVMELERFENFAAHLRNLGGRHAGYGVRREHMALGSAALMSALAGRTCAAFTPETRAAWAHVLEAITAEIVTGAVSAASRSPAIAANWAASERGAA